MMAQYDRSKESSLSTCRSTLQTLENTKGRGGIRFKERKRDLFCHFAASGNITRNAACSF
jgi:hypothetical protein